MVATPANALNIATAGVVRFDGTTYATSSVTNHAVIVGGASNALTSIGVSSVSGALLQSAGAGADPTWSTASYPSSTTANRILYSSATNTVGQITSAANGVLISDNSNVPSMLANGTAGQILTANSGAPPSWTTITGSAGFSVLNIQRFTYTGTYTPTSNMKYCIVEMVGGGGAGGGTSGGGANTTYGGGNGGGGGYARAAFSAATIGASKSVTIGAGGTGVSGGTGNSGGTTSLGSTLLSAGGGSGGQGAGTSGGVLVNMYGGNPGTGGTSSSTAGTAIFLDGEVGITAVGAVISGVSMWMAQNGYGSSSILGLYGIGNYAARAAGNTVGTDGGSVPDNTGCGGNGCLVLGVTATSYTGGNGSAGLVIITEFI